ncbi:MAG: hypothetical protein JSW28_03365 [Thermoplasmata archaeon]|nr:MAG: hypothetical protein JSW28_03365 [Thermoplasmata archaeon]
MQSVPDGFYIPPPKIKFETKWKIILYGIIIPIVILLASVMIPIRTEDTKSNYLFDIKLTPSFTGEYYVHFPFYIAEDPLGMVIREFQMDGAFELINTQYGTTLNISGKGPIIIDGLFSFNRNKENKIYSIKEDDFVIFLNNISAENTLQVAFSSFITTGGIRYNIYGHKLMHWHGIGPSQWGNATFEDDGWQTFPNLTLR